MKRRITITIPEAYLDHLDIHFGELDLSISQQVRLGLRWFIEHSIRERQLPLSNRVLNETEE